MRWAACLLLILPAVFPPAYSQTLRVFSEFTRFNTTGEAAIPAEPREILSPAIARNAFASFQVQVKVPKNTPYELYVGLNPEDAVQVTMYRETGFRLDRVDLPARGMETQVYWMDVWAARDSIVRRIKVEPQLHVGGDWVVYPMEVRVMEATVPEGARSEGTAAPISLMQQFLCGGKLVQPASRGVSVQGLQYRNAQQDLALAEKAPRADLEKVFGACNAPMPSNPEAYLKIRDYLFRLR